MSVDTGESVYALIPPPKVVPQKPPVYRSKYPGDIPPTYSTFGKTTVGLTNAGGDFKEQPLAHQYKKPHALFGPKQSHTSDPTQFLKRQSKPELPQPRRFVYPDADQRRPPLVRKDEKPPQLPRKEVNFIRANTIAAIRSPTKRPAEAPTSFTKRPGFGKVPDYLHEVKRDVEAEKEMVRQARERQAAELAASQPRLRQMPEEERLELLDGLKRRWDEVNRLYQNLTHITTLDSTGKVRKKEQYEMELSELERNIARLEKPVVLIAD